MLTFTRAIRNEKYRTKNRVPFKVARSRDGHAPTFKGEQG